MKPSFAITLGDPLGIGPEIVAKALKDPAIKKLANWVLLGETEKFPSWSKIKKLSPEKQKTIFTQAGLVSLQALEKSMELYKEGFVDGVVTAPVSKTHLSYADFKFPGQTEFFAHRLKVKNYLMMLASPTLKVVLVTIHIPLKKVFSQITTPRLVNVITQVNQSLKRDFGLKKPKIAVCGLNPHAGENGLMGLEEKKIISPAITKTRRKGINVSGPHPSDTVFYMASQGLYDVVICHYHDQGLIPLKTLSFDTGVNVTLGLPLIRTSPDHGVAFDIAGKNRANPSSLKMAMKMAVKIWGERKK